MPCGPDCPFCRLPSHDERAIAALRRDVEAYRLLSQCALASLAEQAHRLKRKDEQLADLREELRRYTQAMVSDTPAAH